MPMAPSSEALAQRPISGVLSVMVAPASEIRKKASAAKRETPPVWWGEKARDKRAMREVMGTTASSYRRQ
jgi:hypothetical protein